MEPGETDWSGLDTGEGKGGMDSMSDMRHRQESSGGLDNNPEPMYDSSNLGGEDDYMSSLGLYDGYDSYNDSGGTTEEDERYDARFEPPSYSQTSKAAALQKKHFRFLNGKEGMATCEQCGSVGVRHAFYSKSKRFCSLSCSRSFATAQREGKSVDNPPAKKGKPSAGGRKSKSQGQQKTGLKQETKEFDWGIYLISNMARGAPVPCFSHIPMSDSWDQIGAGMKLEVANTDCDLPYPVFWIASVVRVDGFTALMRYEGFGNDASHDFWVSLVSPDLHPVGWCATKGKPLVPPQSIQSKYNDWKEFLVKRLTGSRTLPEDFFQLFQEGMTSHKFSPGMMLEVVNKVGVSSMKVAIISEVVGGRIRMNYVDSKEEADEFWCHMRSPLIHHVGWSLSMGHNLEASKEYRSSCLSKVTTHKFTTLDVSPDMMPKTKETPNNMLFTVGMKLEAIDPLNLSAICVATVMKVLRHNYLMIGIDGSPMVEAGSDWFCYHATSPCIFPVGFCEINNIELTPPKGHKGTFKWFDYLKQTRSVAAPVKLFDKDIPKHGFRPGMKIEAVDLMEPRLICVATVTRIVGRLLRIHFDGWENEYDQWVDCQSPDIYPVGWCQAMKYTLEGPRIKGGGWCGVVWCGVVWCVDISPVGWCQAMKYTLEGPRIKETTTPLAMVQKKKKARNQIYKGPRKKRKSKPGLPPFPPGYRFLSSDGGRDKYFPPPASRGGLVRPPHVPLPPEAVAANLPPLADPDLPEATKKGSRGGLVRPPHVPLPPEAVATNLPPLADPDLPEATKKAKVDRRSSKESPMEVSTPVTPTPPSHPLPSDTLPTLSPKGGSVPDVKTTSQLPSLGQGGEWAKQSSASTTSGSGGSSGTTDILNNNSGPPQQHKDNPSPQLAPPPTKPSSSLLFTPSLQKRAPQLWSAQDVCLFLSVNDCGACSDTVLRRNICGRDLLLLSADEEISLAGTKVGPSLRITQLLQQLRSYVNARSSSTAPSATVPAAMETD
ncbi:hypothetical protein ACOMHN_055637 [Nucella lapillus]